MLQRTEATYQVPDRNTMCAWGFVKMVYSQSGKLKFSIILPTDKEIHRFQGAS